MLILERDFQLILKDFLFIVENTAHIPLILRAICKPNHCIWKLGCGFCIHFDWL